MSDTFSTYHPVINILFFVGVIGVTIFVVHPVVLGISLFCAVAYAVLLRGGKSTIRMNVIFLIPLLVVVLLNPLFAHYGVTILAYLPGGNPLTLESLVYGLVLGVMLFCTLMWFACYTEVFTTDKFVYLFGKIIPALSLVFSMTLRFVPDFFRRAGVISNGQKCVGRSVSSGSVAKRVSHGITIFSILLTWALENSVETSDSMKCRGYGERGRTAFSIYRFDRRDGLCLLFMAVSFGITLWGFSQGYTYASYNPRIIVEGVPITVKSMSVFLSYGAFGFMPTFLELVDRQSWKQRRKTITESKVESYRLWERCEM